MDQVRQAAVAAVGVLAFLAAVLLWTWLQRNGPTASITGSVDEV